MYSSIFLFLNMGGSEMILIFVVALLLFGGKKLPELARGLGKGLREFKDASDGIKREIHNNINSIHDAADTKTAGTNEGNLSDEDTGVSSENEAHDTADIEDTNIQNTKIAH